MGFRFQRRFKILPGIRINLSKSGVSTSIGVRGAYVTVGQGKVRETVGIPGTGLSYTHVESVRAAKAEPATPGPPQMPQGERKVRVWLAVVIVIAMVVLVLKVSYR